ncbi:MAG: hypothetical protein MKZ59_06540 [Deinococcales bacterium]|nr:hypothetical protein [Deinococcales bacterium]
MSSLVAIVLVLYGLLISFCLIFWAVLKVRRASSKNTSQLNHDESHAWPRTNRSKDLTILKIPSDDQGSNQIPSSGINSLEGSSGNPDAKTNDPDLRQAERIQPKHNSRKNDAFERFLRGDRDRKGS